MSDIHHKDEMMDLVTIGERGQIVIPAPIRERFDLKAGDKLMVLTKGHMIGLVPSSQFKAMVAGLTAKLSLLEDEADSAADKD